MDIEQIKISGYQIESTLGHGGMATVYLAIQDSFERKVAIKIMAEQLSSDPSFGERFLREAKIVSRLIHPNIVTVYDVGVINNHHYLAMEYIEGSDLKERLNDISLFHILKVMKEVALALDFAGRKGYVHRDIKPENIMINDEDGRAVLMDFGIAKAFDTVSEMTQTGTAIGTPYYMSPEQAKGKEVDWRSDLYSLGVVFYQLLTGTLPYQGDSAVTVGIKHLTDPIPKIPDYLQPVFQPVIDTLMAKKSEDRYQNGGELITALNEISDETLEVINEQFCSVNSRNIAKNINHKVSAPITTGWSKSATPKPENADEDDAATQVVDIKSVTNPKTSDSNKKTIVIPAAAALLLAVGAGGYYMSSDNSEVAPQPQIAATPTKNETKTDANTDTNANNEESVSSSMPGSELSYSSNSQQAAQNTNSQENTSNGKSAELVAKEALAEANSEKLNALLTAAARLEVQLAEKAELELIDELYQQYQLISLLESEHPNVVMGFEQIQTSYLTIIEEHLHANDIQKAESTLNKKLRRFPDLANSDHIVSLQKKIDQTLAIQSLLSKAKQHLIEDQLTGEDHNNAHHYYSQVISIDPAHPEATQGISKIVDRYHALADSLAEQEKYKQALTYINRGISVAPEKANKLQNLKNEIQQQQQAIAQQNAENKQIEDTLQQASSALSSENLTPEETYNALALFQQVLEAKPDNSAAANGIKEIELKLASPITDLIENSNFDQAESEIANLLSYFPDSSIGKTLRSSLSQRVQEVEDASKPKISTVMVKGTDFSAIEENAATKIKADRTIYLGIDYANFGDSTTVLQATLFDGSKSLKISVVPVILTSNSGQKFFKISRPVNGFTAGGYFLDLILKDQVVTSLQFSIEN